MGKIKTATVTWITYNNCGTFLQAYALQHIVQSLGYENHILNDAPHLMDSRPLWRRILSRFYHKLMLKQSKKMDLVARCYTHFRNKWLEIDWHTVNLERVNGRYDMFLCGSDQIWSPIIKPFYPYFFLNFTDKKKVSYAPSLGNSEYSNEWKQFAVPLLQRFAHLSVREHQGAELLSNLLHRNVSTVLDPTMLLTADECKPLCARRIMPADCKYLFCYMLTYNAQYIDMARDYALKHNLEFVLMGLHAEYECLSKHIVWGGPSEFLSAVCYADVIMTDSFHATIFSILFKKEFYTFQRFKAGTWNNQNSRLENLFETFAIKGRFVENNQFDKVPPIDYNEVFLRLDKERKDSKGYLIKALKD